MRKAPFPRRTYGMSTVVGEPNQMKRFRIKARTSISATRRLISLTMIHAPSGLKNHSIFPGGSLQAAGGLQNLVPNMRAQPRLLSHLDILARGSDRLYLQFGNRFMAAFGIVGAISADWLSNCHRPEW